MSAESKNELYKKRWRKHKERLIRTDGAKAYKKKKREEQRRYRYRIRIQKPQYLCDRCGALFRWKHVFKKHMHILHNM